MSKDNKQLTTKTSEAPSINSSSFLSKYQNIEEIATAMYKSNICPADVKNPQDLIIRILKGRELGLMPMTAIDNIHVINGKAGFSVNLYTAMLIQAGITYKIIKNFEPVYEYVTQNMIRYSEEDIKANPNKFQVVTKETDKTKYNKDCVQVQRAKIDIATEIEFKRKVKGVDGKLIDISHIERFTWSDAVQEELATKDNYVKKPRKMFEARCFTRGARVIAPDLYMGNYSDMELADSAGVDYEVNENDGATTIILNPDEKQNS